ncbi:hypothetical protein SGM_3112 [Streptomyces griseoaurantiacus M045]|uniref:Uncharacterized protein n=1 Tax=Streptomyces griseoaurantiacus M045 TaxID=996637 RepID=F3NIS3_9ACTN|nr:hypothetical protein SGM_3112 [Streptomyces griseoaurantiacus M045]
MRCSAFQYPRRPRGRPRAGGRKGGPGTSRDRPPAASPARGTRPRAHWRL